MKLATFTIDGSTRIGAVVGESVIDLGKADGALAIDMLDLLKGGAELMDRARKAALADPHYALADVVLEAPLNNPQKFLALGVNYEAHAQEAREAGIDIPDAQMWFTKQASCITGPYHAVEKPKVSDALDYEVELAIVIGKAGRHIPAAQALDHISGFTICNDISVRDWQRHTAQFMIGKSFDTHGPIGPVIVTSDEIGDPHNLDIKCFVNGEERQSSNTRDFRFDCAEQIAYLSQAMTLQPGDIIATGTPAGIGAGFKPPKFLKAGDVVRCEIEKIGFIENKIVLEA